MTAEAWKRAARAMEKIEKVNTNIIAGVLTAIVMPFYLPYAFAKDIYNRLSGKIYVKGFDEWITKEEHQKRIMQKKYQNRELPLPPEGHTIEDNRGRIYFFEKRKLKIPYDVVAYVETEHCAEMHRFMDENKEWLDAWQQWHGWDIRHYDAEEIKEDMLYPQDFDTFRHGFLWNSGASSSDHATGVFGSIHYYFDIDTSSDSTIKEQMDQMMSRIYNEIHY